MFLFIIIDWYSQCIVDNEHAFNWRIKDNFEVIIEMDRLHHSMGTFGIQRNTDNL